MKTAITILLSVVGLALNGQATYKLYSSGTNLSSPKPKGGYVDSEGNKLLLMCDGTSDICLIKSGASGDLIWARKYRISVTDEDAVASFVESGQFYFLFGNTGYSPAVDGLVLKIRRTDGLCVLAKRFGGAVVDMFTSAIAFTDTTFLVSGYSNNNSFVPSSGITNKGDGIIVEMNHLLDTVRTIKLGAYNRFDRFDRMIRASNGDVFALGVKSPPSGSTTFDNDDMTLVRFTSSLVPVFAKSFHQSVSSFEQPVALVEGSPGTIFGISRLPIVGKTSITKFRTNGNLVSSICVDSSAMSSAMFMSSLLCLSGQKSSGRATLTFVDTVSGNISSARSYTFGSSSYSNIQTMNIGPSYIEGFGFGHGVTKGVWFRGDLAGSIGTCDGFEDAFASTSSNAVDTSRPFNFLTARFNSSGSVVSVSTENILPLETSCLSGTLPVELLRFEAEVVDQIPLLLWVTATERLASHFVIERSLLGSSFVPIGEVLAHGTSSVEIEYSFRDFEAIEGLWYYRLKMVDQDGTEEISNTIPVLVGRDEANPFLAPNPASKETRLISVSGTVFVCDLFGRVLLVEDASHIELTNIPNGLYIVISQDLGVKVPLVVEH